MSRLRGRALQRRRALFRDLRPWCESCLARGEYVAWTQLDHIVALVNGGTDTDDNLQGLCARCHSIKTQKDLGQTVKGCDKEGMPIDPDHHWNNSNSDD